MIRYATEKPAHYYHDFSLFLYNRQEFLQTKHTDVTTFYALHDENQQVVAQIHVAIDQHKRQAISLPQSPFGSVEFSQHIDDAVLSYFIAFLKETLLKQLVQSIQIRECIPVYRAYGSERLSSILQQQQFVVQQTMTNHHIYVDSTPFASKIHKMELKRLRKCSKAGFSFQQESLHHITGIYHFIQTCRQQKGWSLSMTLEEVKQSVAAMPAYYRVFALYDRHICVAACIAVLVTEGILYVYAQASLQEYNSYSPVVSLLDGVYEHCQKHHIQVLDLGTSPTASLQYFKAHVGGIASQKINWLYTVKAL